MHYLINYILIINFNNKLWHQTVAPNCGTKLWHQIYRYKPRYGLLNLNLDKIINIHEMDFYRALSLTFADGTDQSSSKILVSSSPFKTSPDSF